MAKGDSPVETTESLVRPVKPKFAARVHEWLEKLFGDYEKVASVEPFEVLASKLIADAVRERGTDIHIEPHENEVCVRLRVDGRLHDVVLLPKEEGNHLIGRFKAMAGIDPVPLIKPMDGRAQYSLEDGDVSLRVSCSPCYGGEKLAIRILDPDRTRLSVSELGLGDDQHQMIDWWLGNINGMFLVVGPTGSGKTTTLYALLHELKILDRSVITIEDPIEYWVEGITQISVNERRGLTFGTGIKSMLRLDPDFLLVGEIRDSASAEAAIEASATGKVVLSTLHSRDAAGAVTALRNMGVHDHEIAAALEVVVSQRLVRQLCSKCKKKVKLSESDRGWLKAVDLEPPAAVWQGRGCEHCRQTGYYGRTGIFEVWKLDGDTSQQILEHADERSIRTYLRRNDIGSLLRDGLKKVETGITTLEELRQVGAFSFSLVNSGADNPHDRRKAPS